MTPHFEIGSTVYTQHEITLPPDPPRDDLPFPDRRFSGLGHVVSIAFGMVHADLREDDADDGPVIVSLDSDPTTYVVIDAAKLRLLKKPGEDDD